MAVPARPRPPGARGAATAPAPVLPPSCPLPITVRQTKPVLQRSCQTAPPPPCRPRGNRTAHRCWFLPFLGHCWGDEEREQRDKTALLPESLGRTCRERPPTGCSHPARLRRWVKSPPRLRGAADGHVSAGGQGPGAAARSLRRERSGRNFTRTRARRAAAAAPRGRPTRSAERGPPLSAVPAPPGLPAPSPVPAPLG